MHWKVSSRGKNFTNNPLFTKKFAYQIFLYLFCVYHPSLCLIRYLLPMILKILLSLYYTSLFHFSILGWIAVSSCFALHTFKLISSVPSFSTRITSFRIFNTLNCSVYHHGQQILFQYKIFIWFCRVWLNIPTTVTNNYCIYCTK